MGNERGRLLSQGTARVGQYFQVDRIPVVKNQGISAYDPRVIEVTGISMMLTAQGADHTAGNLPTFQCDNKSTEELVEASLDIQAACAAVDSLGLCVFGRSVTNVNHELIVTALNDAQGTDFDTSFFMDLGRETLKMEWEFNRRAGFTELDDELPAFFHDETLMPANKKQRHKSAEVIRHVRKILGSKEAQQ